MQEVQTLAVHQPRRAARFGRGLGAAALALCVLALGACEEGGLLGTDDDDLLSIETLVITAADNDLVEGGTSHFQAQARTAGDVPVDTATIRWTSRDPSVATVGESTGTVTAVMWGETYIVAETGAGETLLQDSALVSVAMPALTGLGQAEIRIRGAFTESYSWTDLEGSELVAEESLGGDEHDISYLTVPFSGDDLVFFAALPRTSSVSSGSIDLADGEWVTLLEQDPSNALLEGPVALFFVEGDTAGLYYGSTGGTLTIETVSGEPGYTADESEEVYGRFEMTAVGYLMNWETDEVSETGDTIQVAGLFSADYLKTIAPYATMTVTTDSAVELTDMSSYVYQSMEGLKIQVGGSSADVEYFLSTTVPGADVGEFPIDSTAPDFMDVDDAYVRGEYGDWDAEESSFVELYSDGGTVTIDQWVDAPMPDGVLEAEISALLNAYDGEGFTGEQLGVEIYVIAPSQEADDFLRAESTRARGLLRIR